MLTADVEMAKRAVDAILDGAAQMIAEAQCCALAVEALSAARDALVSFAKQASYIPWQRGYSTRVTELEMKVLQAVQDIDAVLKQLDESSARSRGNEERS